MYKAEDIKLKRSVALKFLLPHLVDSPELKERVLIEAQAAAAPRRVGRSLKRITIKEEDDRLGVLLPPAS